MAEDALKLIWDGLTEFNASLGEFGERVQSAGQRIVVKAGALLIRNAQANFEGSHPKGQPHVGGDKPNVVTGYLRRSITMTPVIRTGIGEYSTTVGPTAIYGRAVELGLRNGMKYPYFQPAVELTQPLIAAIAEEEWAAAVG